MPALRSKVLHVKMLENDNFREYTYPELFNGATPDFCHVQSVGNRVDKSEPDVGRDSVRFSNGYAIAGQTWCSANTADASGPTCMHTQTYSYVNLPTPESDDSSGTTRQSRGTVTLIPNGIRVTNDSAYTTENHNVIISIVGGTDIEEVAMLRVTNNDADGTEASSSGMKWAMPFKGCNFMLTLGGGGPVDVVHNAFQEAHGAIWCTNGGGGNNGFGGTYSSNYTRVETTTMMVERATGLYKAITRTPLKAINHHQTVSL